MVILSTFIVPPALKVLFARKPQDSLPDSLSSLGGGLDETLY